MFCFCGNNPILRVDYDGHFWKEIASWFKNTWNHSRKVFNNLRTDIRNFSFSNTDESIVLKSNYFSCYKGYIALHTPLERPTSFGIILLSSDMRKVDSYTINRLRHEYGHTWQLRLLGKTKYLLYIAIPSALKLGSREYYEKPWEITADYFGGVIPDTNHTLKEAYLKDGFDYLLYAKYYELLTLPYMFR